VAEHRFQGLIREAGLKVFIGADAEASVFQFDAIVVEEDTHLVLSAPPVAREMREAPRALLSHAEQTFAKKPGLVIVLEHTTPVRFLAIVYDFDAEPISTEEWVRSALQSVIDECRARGLTSLSIPVLGARYGPMRIERFTELLRDALADGDR